MFILFCSASSLITAATISSVGTLSGSVSNAGVVTGGGLWSATTTWAGGVVPGASDSVIIVSGDLVYSGTTAIVVLSLTVQGSFCQQAGVTGTGSFTLTSSSYWYAGYGSATKLPGGFGNYTIDSNSNWVFTSLASSTLINGLPALYGNMFVYKQGSILAGATNITAINIQGNLTIDNGSASSAVKGANNKSSASTTIHVGGNVYIKTGILSGVDAVMQTTSCTYNIDGSVYVGDAGTASGQASLAPVSGADASYQRTGTFNINGNLSYINGAKLEAGTNGTSTNTLESAVINLKGNLSTDATVVTATNTPGTFSINFVGTGAQTITLGAALVFSPATAFILKINNSAGVTLNSSAIITGILNLLAGNLTTTSTNLLTLTAGSSVTGGSTTSFINGPLAYQYSAASPTSLTYPIGKGGIYRPLTLSLTQSAATLSTYTAEMFNVAPSSNTFPGTLDKVSSVRYYSISEGTGGSAFTAGSVILNYSNDDGVSEAANLRIAQGPVSGGGLWVDLGGTGTATTTGTITSNNFTDLTTNTIFTLANNAGGSNPLPVELTSFTASNNGRNIQISWTTKTEENSNKFEIERSLYENQDWVIAGSVKASGTINTPRNYSYIEKNTQAGKYQYRLKMIDNNGSYKYSNIIEAEIAVPKAFAISQNYPNPFNPTTKIDYQVPVDSKVILEVYNIAGQKIIELVNQEQSAGYYTVDFGSTKLSSGVYIYRLAATGKAAGNNFTSIKKMILMK
jgi:hypothetical protein